MSFAAENGVGIQQRSISDVIERFFLREKVYVFNQNTS